METLTKNKLYEGMFLVDSSLAGSDWDGTISSIRKILEKAEAEIVSIKKWDDRKLAYDIKGKSRGTYILSYFKVDGGRISDIEKSVRLSEKIMRVLILSGEKLSQEDIDKDTPAMKLESEKQEDGQETTRGSRWEPEGRHRYREETEDEDDFEQTDDTDDNPDKETEDFKVSDISTNSDDITENQPQQNQTEGYEQTDKNEQF